MSLRITKKSPEGKKGWFIKSTWKFLLIVLFMSGCSYHKVDRVSIEGKGIGYGVMGVKGDVAKVTIEREVQWSK